VKKAIADALAARGYDSLTPVQEAVTNPELSESDLLVSAQTGSGKTVGFGLAIAPTLLGEDEAFATAAAPLALIIAPTRELALQVKRELAWLYAGAGAVLASCVGGMDMRDERRALDRGAHVVVATPGRLRDHIMRGSINLGSLRAVVLDEADEMLDLGFREDLEFILGETPPERRTLMFSATVPRGIANLAQSYQNNAVRVTTLAEASQHADIEYLAMNVAQHDAENAIINVLRFYEAPNALVFANTRAMVNRITTRLSNRGFAVVSLSGELSQAERSHALQAMRDGRARVCVATDVAARGIDLPNLDLVVHAELPNNFETLLHRSGRTGRAGRKGVSALIVPPKIRRKAERVLQMAKLTASWGPAPSADAVAERDEARMLADPAWSEPLTDSETAPVAKLLERFTPKQLAAAYLRLYHTRVSAPEDLSAPDAVSAPTPRAAFGPSQWFSVEGGRNAGAEPRRLLPMLCKAGNLSREDIGAIRVQPDESLIEIRQSAVPGFLAALGDAMAVEGGALVRAAEGRPSPAGKPAPRKAPAKPRSERPATPRSATPRAEPVAAAPAPAVTPTPIPTPAPEPARKPRHEKPRAANPSAPIDWNDAPAPRQKKPKPGPGKAYGKHSGKPAGKTYGRPSDKPGGKPSGKPPRKPEAKRDDSVHSDIARKRSASDPSQSLRGGGKGKPGGKGPKPPIGKPSSKKNRARAAETGQVKAGKGGGAKPRRKP
jgi:ATP-dependent RNA helicase DeaD